jgi:6-phosphogluconate dehydrogenase
MDLGLIGLGKMGGNMRERLRRAGHTVVGYDRNPELSDADSLEAMLKELPSPKIVWVMVPAGEITRATVRDLNDLLGEGDIVIDGGNSRWTDDKMNGELLAKKGIGFIDCGVSGGVWGLENGYALMAGGDKKNIETVQPIFDALKPEGEFGWVHAGSIGAGHFSKMVHNGVEYALMQAYAEGWELLSKVEEVDNVTEVFRSWREGTVIRSWLLDLLVAALDEDDHLDKIAGYAEDSGEGRWTVEAGIDNAVPTPAITAALYARFVSRQDDSPAMKAVAAMRNQFGGHATRTAARRPPVAARLPVLSRGRRRARPGGDRVRRSQRPGEDQPRRGRGLRRTARLAPRRGRCTTRALRRRAGRGPCQRRTRRAPGAPRGADQSRALQPGAGEPVAVAPVPRPPGAGADGAVLARGPGPGQG